MPNLFPELYDSRLPATNYKRSTLFPELEKEEGSFFDKISRGFKETKASYKAGVESSKAGVWATAKNLFDVIAGYPEETRKKQAKQARGYADILEKIGLPGVAQPLEKYAEKKETVETPTEMFWEHLNKDVIGDKFNTLAKTHHEQAKKFAAEIQPDERKLGKKLLDPFWYTKGLAQTLPNMLGALAVGSTAAVATGGNPFIGGAAAFAYAASLEGGSGYLEAKDMGATEKQADQAMLAIGGINGMLEIIPIMNLINKSPSGKVLKQSLIKQIAKAYVKQGLEEGPTEAVQEMVSNYVARIYNPNNPVFTQAVTESGILGFVAGGTTGAVHTAAGIPTEIRADIILPEIPEVPAAPQPAYAVTGGRQYVAPREEEEPGVMYAKPAVTEETAAQATVPENYDTSGIKRFAEYETVSQVERNRIGYGVTKILGLKEGQWDNESGTGQRRLAQRALTALEGKPIAKPVTTAPVVTPKTQTYNVPQGLIPKDVSPEIAKVYEMAWNKKGDWGEASRYYNSLSKEIKAQKDFQEMVIEIDNFRERLVEEKSKAEKKVAALPKELSDIMEKAQRQPTVQEFNSTVNKGDLVRIQDAGMTPEQFYNLVRGVKRAPTTVVEAPKEKIKTRTITKLVQPKRVTEEGFDYSLNKTYRFNTKKSTIESIAPRLEKRAPKPGVKDIASYADIKVMGHSGSRPILRVSYDPNEALRESGTISQREWANTGAKIAEYLKKQGVPENSLINYDGENMTLAELVNKKMKIAKPTEEGPAVKKAPPQTPADPENPKDEEFQKELLEAIKEKKIEEMHPVKSEVLTSKKLYNNPFTQTAYKLYYKLVDAITNGALGGITPSAGRSQEAFALIREKARIYDSVISLASKLTQKFAKYSKQDRAKIAEEFHQYIPIEDAHRKDLLDAHTFIGSVGGQMVKYQNKWVDEELLKEGEMLLPEDVWQEGVGSYGRSVYLKEADLLGIQRLRPSAYVSTNRVNTSMFKKKLTPVDWGMAALFYDGKIENKYVTGMRHVNDKLGNFLMARKFTVKKLASMTEQELLAQLPIGKVKLYAETDPVLMKQTDKLMKDLGITEEQALSLRGQRLGQFNTLTKEIKTMFAVNEDTRLHEVGHGIDSKYDIQDLFFDNKVERDRVRIKNELRLVADSRYQRVEDNMGPKVSDYFKKYVRKQEEKVAEFFSMYVADRKTLKKIAPTAVRVFEEVAADDPILQQVIDMRPSRVAGRKVMLASPSNVAKNIIKEAKILVDSDNLVDLTDTKLAEIGLKAKKENGWINSIDVIFDRTIREMTHNMANMAYFDAILHNPNLYSAKAVDGWVDMKDIKEGMGWLGPLREGFVNPDLKADLETIVAYGTREQNSEFWSRLIGIYKMSKTSLSIPTVIRNYLSGSFVQTDLAGAPLWGITKDKDGNLTSNAFTYAKAVSGYIGKDDRYSYWAGKGLFGSDYYAVEVDQDVLRDIITRKKGDVSKIFDKPLSDKSKKAYQWMMEKTKYYGAVDHMARMYLAEYAIQKGLDPVEAVYFANKWQLDYRFVPKIIEQLRGGKGVGAIPGLLMPFISFSYLMSPRIVEVMMTRPWVLLKYPIALSALNAYSQLVLGVDDEEKEANMPTFLRSERDWTYLLPWRDEGGNLQYMNLSYTLPFGKPDAKKPWTWAFVDVAQLNQMYMSGPAIWQTANNVMQNYDPYTEREIYKEYDSNEIKFQKISKYLERTMMPSTLSNIRKLYEAFVEKKETGYPIPKAPSKSQAVEKFFGGQVYSGGMNTVMWKIRDEEEKIYQIKGEMKKVLSDRSRTFSQKQTEYKRLMGQVMDSQKRIMELYRGLSIGEKKEIEFTFGDLIEEMKNENKETKNQSVTTPTAPTTPTTTTRGSSLFPEIR